MSVKVSFLESKPAANEAPGMTVPKSAIKTEGMESFVWALREGAVRRVPIVRGREVEAGIEVKQGLKDGDIVVVASQASLGEGQKVIVGHEGADLGAGRPH